MEFINSWVQGIIVAVFIATIIEMILPNGNSKKYIKMILGIFIVFNIISPIVTKFIGKEIRLEDAIDIEKYVSSISAYSVNNNNITDSNNSNIKEIYILNLKKDMKAKIEDKGYIVNSVQIDIEDDENYTIKKVDLTISKKEKEEKDEKDEKQENTNTINKIEEVNIEININKNDAEQKDKNREQINNTLTTKETNEIKDYINSTYEIKKDCIFINQ